MITGLVAITPAAGVVAGWGAIIIGVASGSVPWWTMNFLSKKVAFLRKVDDTLGVFHTHAVAGLLGGVLVGFLATETGCLAFACVSTGGAVAGNWRQIGLQLLGGVFIILLNVIVTSVILLLIKLVVPLRMSDEELAIGDDAVHGEEAYAFFGDGQRHLPHGAQGDIERNPIERNPVSRDGDVSVLPLPSGGEK